MDCQQHFSGARFLQDLTRGWLQAQAPVTPSAGSESYLSHVWPMGAAATTPDRIMLLCPTTASLERLRDARVVGTACGYAPDRCFSAVSDDLVIPSLPADVKAATRAHLVVLPLDSCTSGPGARSRIDAFFGAIPAASTAAATWGGNDATPLAAAAAAAADASLRRPVFIVVANMATTHPEQVSFVRRYIDERLEAAALLDDGSAAADDGGTVPGSLGSLGPLAIQPQVVLLLHLSAEQLTFRPIYHATAVGWSAVYADAWGEWAAQRRSVESGGVSESKGNDAAAEAASEVDALAREEGEEDALPWVRMLFGLGTNMSVEAVRATFSGRVREALRAAIGACCFPRLAEGRRRVVPPGLTASLRAYSPGSTPSQAQAWVRGMLEERSYIEAALVDAFAQVCASA